MEDQHFDLLKCAICGKAFAQEAGKRPTCPDCLAEEEVIYRKVRNLVNTCPDRRINVAEAARRLGIEERKINYLVECGMFELAVGVGLINRQQGD
ncbi:MAG: hypothetical protein LBG29_03270 [Synergistaceae bacterium]|jgi:ABC-type ATPase with predicted acetyltransferase domain|nr:hypothetical protein [Synergistaceae bacterium]